MMRKKIYGVALLAAIPLLGGITFAYPTCNDPDITIGEYTISACNVGATQAGTGEESYGAYFQWGNNYPFPTTGDVLTGATLVDTSSYWPLNPYYSGTFITAPISPNDWSSPQNDNLWGNTGTELERQGPCEIGYHLPTNLEWQGVVDTLYTEGVFSGTKTGNSYNRNNDEMLKFMTYLKISLAGYRNRASSVLNNQDFIAYYWTSVPNGSNAFFLTFGSSVVSPQNALPRGVGFSVRCFKNEDPRYQPCTTITDISKAECKALVDFYYSTNGDGWITGNTLDIPTNKPRLTGTQASNWYGVSLSGGHVSALSLNSNNLSGVLVDSFWNLTYLTDLSLRTNEIYWTLPVGMKTFTQLKTISLAENNLSGPFPEVIRYWTNLETLGLPRNAKEWGNTFYGWVPSWINELTKVWSFNINGCKIGSLPKEIFEMPSLTTLLVQDNNLTSISPEVFTSTIVTLNLGGNQLPSSLLKDFALKSWSSLYLNENNFVGPIPSERATLSISNVFFLSGNKLSGQFSTGMTIKDAKLSIDNNCLDTVLSGSLSGWMDSKSSNGSGRRLTQTACQVPTPTPTPAPSTSWWGGGGSISKDNCPNGDFSPSYYDDECGTGKITEDSNKIAEDWNKSSTETEDNTTQSSEIPEKSSEILWAYQRAYNHNITTLAPLEAANPDGTVIRQHLAKMVVNYALNALWRTLPEKVPAQCHWKDGSNAWESQEMKDYAVKACSLGLMGIDMDYFQPYAVVTRAQFGTILSRLLRQNTYAGGKPYYTKHLQALKGNGIMTQIDNPETRIELRQRVRLMLMRSAK